MRKKISLILTVVIIGYGTFLLRSHIQNQQPESTPLQMPKSDNRTIEPFRGDARQTIFIPYWDLPASPSEGAEYNSLIYFGVSPDASGELNHDAGFKNVSSFIHNTSSDKERLLTVRMLDTEDNLAILGNGSLQSTVVSESVAIAKKFGFDGIVLDLEMGVIPFENTKDSITSFVKLFSEATHTESVTFSLTLYGDTFYRARPYDVREISRYVDQIYIMAYDFHKSRGEPGPNFPLTRQSVSTGGLVDHEYGYDFQTMVDDFASVVPREKITVLFGMYGYDWTLGPQGKPLKAATAIPLNEIENGYSDCEISVIPDLIRNPEKVTGSPIGVGDDMCINYINPTSVEKHIFYADEEGYDHELWYEDEESVSVKIEYLKTQGIGSIGYWVWGYF